MERQFISATLVAEQHEKGRRRFYKMSLPLRLGKSDFDKEPTSVEKDNNGFREKIKEEFRQFVPCDTFDIVCISDAHTHAERLVFVGFVYDFEGETHYARTDAQIGGRHTFLIHGGDSDTMRDDTVYLRRLAQINGYNFKGIEK